MIILFIVLFEQTYDDASCKYTAMIKLKILQQRNYKFISFFSEFLSLVNELNWNKSVKIAALQHAISDEIHAQLVIQKMSKILSKFAILCQQIDENFWYNQFTWSWRIITQSTNAIISFTKTNTLSRNTTTIIHDFMNIDDAWFYTSVDLKEWKNCIAKNTCFDYD